MDRRFLIAIALTALVVLVTPRLLPVSKLPARAAVAADSIRQAHQPGADTVIASGNSPAPAPVLDSLPVSVADTVTVTTEKVTYQFSTVGALPLRASLTGYKSLAHPGELVELARPRTPIARFRLVAAGDTIPLDQMPFAAEQTPATASGTAPLTFRAPIGPAATAAITYTFAAEGYLVGVKGQVDGLADAQLLITLPNGLRSEEVDSLDDIRHLAYVVKPERDDARSIQFPDLDTARARTEIDGPYSWIASKNKYFLVALLVPDSSAGVTRRAFTSVSVAPRPRGKKDLARDAAAMVTLPLTDGRFAFDMYTGPQEWRRLREIGREFDTVNPYGGWLQGFVQPFATICMRALLWLHDTFKLSYGWVLVIFGIAVRLILWPLNQSAMKSSIKMQRLQPEMQALQKKHAQDPQKQQQAMMELYKAHDMSPMSPVLGCLPMLLPMPVLFALFFVFQNTIEFRGVSFLWLSDISQKDPYYILPILMGLSMFLLSWIGMRNSPPNPQAKMMA
ncbi:MAG: membrane protein insertase YidC, partial [Gemmatimonadaceae bacterium]